jgi:uncharacterized protein YbaR (Trm112 family)
MIDKELAEMLVCPKDRLPLKLADPALLSRVNRAIAAGRVKNQAGRAVEDSLSAALVRHDHALLYPIVDDIPVLLIEEAILLDQIEGESP